MEGQIGTSSWFGLHFDRQHFMGRRFAMPLNIDKIDDAALALLYLTLHDGYRAWKGFDWDVLGRLHDKGMIGDPVGKVKSWFLPKKGCSARKRCLRRCSRRNNVVYGGLAKRNPPSRAQMARCENGRITLR
jgi:hypothetical protein